MQSYKDFVALFPGLEHDSSLSDGHPKLIPMMFTRGDSQRKSVAQHENQEFSGVNFKKHLLFCELLQDLIFRECCKSTG